MIALIIWYDELVSDHSKEATKLLGFSLVAISADFEVWHQWNYIYSNSSYTAANTHTLSLHCLASNFDNRFMYKFNVLRQLVLTVIQILSILLVALLTGILDTIHHLIAITCNCSYIILNWNFAAQGIVTSVYTLTVHTKLLVTHTDFYIPDLFSLRERWTHSK